MVAQKFKKGDRVRVIRYGHLMWHSKANWLEQETAMQKIVAIHKDNEYKMFFGELPKTERLPDPPRKAPNNIFSETDEVWWCDISPDLVGKEGVVKGSYADLSEINNWGTERDGLNQKEYHIEGIVGKSAWYDERQLELVE